MKRIIFLLVLIASTVNSMYAQSIYNDPDYKAWLNDNHTNPTALYALPPKQYFAIVPQQYNYQFEYALPNDGRLKIAFLRLSDWGNKNNLNLITATAADRINFIKDSFNAANSEKVVEINIPINNEVIAFNYREDETYKNQLAFKDGNYYHFKTGFDTIRVIKNVGIRTKVSVANDSGSIIQIQYTYILKNITDINALKDNPSILEKIGNITDSIIDVQRKHWNYEDALHHYLSLKVDANNNDSISLKGNKMDGLIWFGLHYAASISVGAIVYNNEISPYGEITIAYVIPTKGNLQGFVGFNINGFGRPSTTLARTSTNTVYSTYNAEFGFFKKGSNMMPQKSSFILGIMNVQGEKPLLNFGINLGINRYLSIGVIEASNLKKGDNNRNVLGVNLKYNL